MVIRSGGMYAARSIFAEVRLPTGSKNAHLADLPPGSVADARGKSVRGKRGKGTESPSQKQIWKIVRASIIGNMKVKQQSVRGRVEIFRLYGCRKILPDLDRDDQKIIGIGSMNRKVHRTLITSHPSKAAIPDWENAYPDKS